MLGYLLGARPARHGHTATIADSRAKIGFKIWAIASAVVNNTPADMSVLYLVACNRACVPPLITFLPNLIAVPRQKARIPPSSNMLAMACMVVVTLADCDRVLMVSNGWLARVVMVPASPQLASIRHMSRRSGPRREVKTYQQQSH